MRTPDASAEEGGEGVVPGRRIAATPTTTAATVKAAAITALARRPPADASGVLMRAPSVEER